MEKISNIKNEPKIQMAIFAVIFAVLVIVSYVVVGIPIVPVCAIAILEALLAVLLNKVPLWIHGMVIIAQIVAGIIFGKLIFMVLMAIVYVCAMVLLYFRTKE